MRGEEGREKIKKQRADMNEVCRRKKRALERRQNMVKGRKGENEKERGVQIKGRGEAIV